MRLKKGESKMRDGHVHPVVRIWASENGATKVESTSLDEQHILTFDLDDMEYRRLLQLDDELESFDIGRVEILPESKKIEIDVYVRDSVGVSTKNWATENPWLKPLYRRWEK